MEHSQIVAECSQYQVPHILKTPRKSIHPFFRDVASSQTDRQTDRPTDKRKNITFAMAEVMKNAYFRSHGTHFPRSLLIVLSTYQN